MGFHPFEATHGLSCVRRSTHAQVTNREESAGGERPKSASRSRRAVVNIAIFDLSSSNFEIQAVVSKVT